MSLWGDSTDTLLVASGTIFNEVLIWPFRPSNGSMPEADIELSESVPEETDKETEIETDSNLLSGSTLQNQKSLLDAFLAATPICRLQGHEGSIYRLVWREDGNYIASVSDDRSARIWKVGAGNVKDRMSLGISPDGGLPLYGHTSRLWDCCMDSQVLPYSWLSPLVKTARVEFGILKAVLLPHFLATEDAAFGAVCTIRRHRFW